MSDGRRSVLPRANVPALPTRRLLGPQLWVAHLFGNEPAEDKFVAPTNRGVWVKPTGGMWTSTYLGPEAGSDWVRWCRGENFANPDTAAWYVLTPRRGLRILRIDTVADLSRATSAYPAGMPDDWPDILRKDLKLDYEALAADGWDAVYLTERGQWRTRFSHPGLYGWDCESTLWLRWGFHKIELVRASSDTVESVKARAIADRRRRANTLRSMRRWSARLQKSGFLKSEPPDTLGGDVFREGTG